MPYPPGVSDMSGGTCNKICGGYETWETQALAITWICLSITIYILSHKMKSFHDY